MKVTYVYNPTPTLPIEAGTVVSFNVYFKSVKMYSTNWRTIKTKRRKPYKLQYENNVSTIIILKTVCPLQNNA